MRHRAPRWVISVAILGTLLFGSGSSIPAVQATASQASVADQCFSQTGKCVRGRFAEYWAANGGLLQQGYPITDEFNETNPTNGRVYRTQYFERARFEYHPENQRPYDVLLGLIGREQFKAKYPGQYLGDTPGPQLVGPGAICFQQTGKCVLPEFYRYWEAHGGLAQFGLPLTYGFMETNPTDGRQYHTVYFERARFEYHPQNAPPYTILLGLLGREQYVAKYPGGPPGAPTAPPSGGAWGPTLAPLAGGRTYAHPSGHFSVSLPASWQVLEADDFTISFGVDSPVAVCTVGSNAIPIGVTLTELDQVVDVWNSELLSYRQIAKDKVVVRGQPAYRRVIGYTFDDGTPIQEEQVYFVTGSNYALVYCITYPQFFAGYATTFDGIAGSITLGPFPAPTPPPGPSPAPSPPPPLPPSPTPPVATCDPSYPTVCIPPPPPDLDCGDIPHRYFPVLPPDPHVFDGDGDGIGCETP